MALADDAAEGHVFTVADRDFHRTIVAFHGNPILTHVYDTLRDRQQRIAATAISRNAQRIEHFIAEHREIAAALGAGDGPQARTLVQEHLIGAHALARRSR